MRATTVTSRPRPTRAEARRRRWPLSLLAVLAALALVAAACGDDGDEPASTATTAAETDVDGSDDDEADDEAEGDDPIAEAWALRAGDLSGEVGDTFDVDCPAGGSAGVVWGTNVYTDDSSICTAAVHVGLITFEEGGEVAIEILDGLELYTGSESNGVETRDYGSWGGSFAFPDAEELAVADTIDWSRRAGDYRASVGAEITVTCEADGEPAVVWGTDVYTDDSSICTAAVHAGIIEADEGGPVTFVIEEGRSSYTGSESNGVTTLDYGEWGGSFSFVED